VAHATRCARDGVEPSRDGFLHEVLFPAATRRTPRFDDHTPGSYHIEKLDLVQGLPEEAKLCGGVVRASLVIGPMGPLWSYHVVALVEEGPNVRVSSLVIPHARITGKGTGLVPVTDADALIERIERSPLVRSGLPPKPRDEFSYRLLLAVYAQPKTRYAHADFDESKPNPEFPKLLDHVNAILSRTVPTYPSGDKVPPGSKSQSDKAP